MKWFAALLCAVSLGITAAFAAYGMPAAAFFAFFATLAGLTAVAMDQ